MRYGRQVTPLRVGVMLSILWIAAIGGFAVIEGQHRNDACAVAPKLGACRYYFWAWVTPEVARAAERMLDSGDAYFFDPALKTTLNETGAAADERLAVFYTCMGLGFMGAYEDRPAEVKNRMKEIAGRIRMMMDSEESGRVCPEAYEATNRSDLTEPPLRPLTPLAVALVGMLIVFFVANIYLYRSASKDLRESLDQIVVQSDGALAAGK